MSRSRRCRVLDLTDSYYVSDDTDGDDDYDPSGSSKKKAKRTNSSKARKGSNPKISKSTPSVKKSPVKKSVKPAILLPLPSTPVKQQTQCASTSTATGDVPSETPEPVGKELKTEPRHHSKIKTHNHPASPDPELRGTELMTLENAMVGGSSHIGQLEQINEDVVYAQIDEDLPSFRRLTNSDLLTDEMPFPVSETLKEIYSISPREVAAQEWEEVYPGVRMCAFNPNRNRRNATTTQRQMIGYIHIDARTLRPFEDSDDMGPTLFICIDGPVVFKTSQFSTNARGEHFLSPITVQSGGSILIGRGVPHSIENRSNTIAKLAYFVFKVGE